MKPKPTTTFRKNHNSQNQNNSKKSTTSNNKNDSTANLPPDNTTLFSCNLNPNLYHKNREQLELDDEFYLSTFNVENGLLSAINRMLHYKPDKPISFLSSYLKLSTTKEYPFSLPLNYRVKNILLMVSPFELERKQKNEDDENENDSDSPIVKPSCQKRDKITTFTNHNFISNIKTCYHMLADQDKIDCQSVMEILELVANDDLIYDLTKKLVASMLKTNEKPTQNYHNNSNLLDMTEIFDIDSWVHLVSNSLIFINLCQALLIKFEELVPKFQSSSGTSILSPDYYSLPSSVVNLFCDLVDNFCLCQSFEREIRDHKQEKKSSRNSNLEETSHNSTTLSSSASIYNVNNCHCTNRCEIFINNLLSSRKALIMDQITITNLLNLAYDSVIFQENQGKNIRQDEMINFDQLLTKFFQRYDQRKFVVNV